MAPLGRLQRITPEQFRTELAELVRAQLGQCSGLHDLQAAGEGEYRFRITCRAGDWHVIHQGAEASHLVAVKRLLPSGGD